MENIPEADYEIVQDGIIRTVCLTRLSNPDNTLPTAKESKKQIIYGIKDHNHEVEEIRFWRLRFYRTEYHSLTISENIIIVLKLTILYFFLRSVIRYIMIK